MGRIIAVGHTAWKMNRLMALIAASDPGLPYELFTVFNGDADNLGFTPDLQVPNNLQGRDINMYHLGLRKVEDNYIFFLNDDVVHLTDGWLATAWGLLAEGYDCVGQPNLAHWVDYDKAHEHFTNITNPDDRNFGKEMLSIDHWKAQGRELRFIRTSHFACTRKWFNEGYQAAYGSAQKFEKGTLRGNVTLFPTIDYVYDGNVEPYV